MAVLLRAYSRALERHPVLTNSTSGALLFGAGDGLAQHFENKRTGGTTPYNYARTTRQVVFGAAIAGPLLTHWYSLLHRMTSVFRHEYITSPCGSMYQRLDLLGVHHKRAEVLVKIAFDQLLFTGAYLNLYIFSMSMMEGHTVREGVQKCKDLLHDAWATSVLFWGPAQCLNFSVVPAPLAPLAVQVFSLIWSVILSHYFHSSTEESKASLPSSSSPSRAALGEQLRGELEQLRLLVAAQAEQIRALEQGAALEDSDLRDDRGSGLESSSPPGARRFAGLWLRGPLDFGLTSKDALLCDDHVDE